MRRSMLIVDVVVLVAANFSKTPMSNVEVPSANPVPVPCTAVKLHDSSLVRWSCTRFTVFQCTTADSAQRAPLPARLGRGRPLRPASGPLRPPVRLRVSRLGFTPIAATLKSLVTLSVINE